MWIKRTTREPIWRKFLKAQLSAGPAAIITMNIAESWPHFKCCVETALQNLCNELAKTQPRYAVVFTSGGVISVAAGKILGLSPNKTFALNWAIANSKMTTPRLVGNEPQLLSLNEHHFIKAEKSQFY